LVLRLFGPERHELTVTEASRLLAMPKSSAGRLLSNMRDVGLLDGGGRQPRYRIGPLFFEISQLYRLRSSLIEQAESVLTSLCRETGHTGYISILQGIEVLVMRVRPGSHALRVVTPPGQRLPACETAIGRSLLARLSDEEVRARYPNGFSSSTPNSPQSLKELLKRLAIVRRWGWEESLEEAVPGVGSTSIAIEDSVDHEIVGLCLTYSASVQKSEKIEMAQLLVKAGRDLGLQIGDPFWAALGSARATG
jgi:DNA-binding IclR family transcriptional regulator